MKTLKETLRESILDNIDDQLKSVKPYDAACFAIEKFFKENYDKFPKYSVKKKPDANGKWIVNVKAVSQAEFILKPTSESLTDGTFTLDKCCKFYVKDNPNIKNLDGLPSALQFLYVKNCSNLMHIDCRDISWERVKSKDYHGMSVYTCNSLEVIDNIAIEHFSPDTLLFKNLPNLKYIKNYSEYTAYLQIENCNKLSDIGETKKYGTIHIENCAFKSLSSISNLKTVFSHNMAVVDCPNLKDLKGFPEAVGSLYMHRDRGLTTLNTTYPDYNDFRKAVLKNIHIVNNIDLN